MHLSKMHMIQHNSISGHALMRPILFLDVEALQCLGWPLKDEHLCYQRPQHSIEMPTSHGLLALCQTTTSHQSMRCRVWQKLEVSPQHYQNPRVRMEVGNVGPASLVELLVSGVPTTRPKKLPITQNPMLVGVRVALSPSRRSEM